MNDLKLGYVLDGRHYGTGIGIGKLPEAFAVREHVEDGECVETLYLPECTCHVVIEDECPVCSECGEDIDPSFAACPYCGARVMEQ